MYQEFFDKLSKIKYKGESIVLNNVYPSLIESLFEFPNGIQIIGGRDLDYEARNCEYHISGSAYYGTCTFTRLTGPIKKEEKKEDVYKRTSFEFKGRLIENVPSVVDCDENTLKTLVDNGVLFLYYICFQHYNITKMIPFYAREELDVRRRALSIWGSYDDIKSGEDVEDIKSRFKESFKNSYEISNTYYVLDWEN